VKVVVGLDGSRQSQVAQQLVSSLGWPQGTQFAFVTAYAGHEPHDSAIPGVGWFHEASAATRRPDLLDELDALADPVRRAGHVVEVRVEKGQPGKVLGGIANEGAADLVVVGSRGHGAAASAFLGSVSADLADHCACPVLVARSPRISRVLVATDGSASAQAIPRVLGRWSLLRGLPFEVLSVAPRSTTGADFLITAWAPSGDGADPRFEDPETVHHWQHVDGLIGELSEAGFPATGVVRHGDPAHEIVAAGQHPGSLIIVGSRGLGDLQRILIGSVAHKVLLHSHCSVLVMRGHVPARLTEGVPAGVRSLSLS